MSAELEEDRTIYKVVVNHEEQYSIWPARKDLPAGWRDGGKEGPKSECLDYINTVWTDMRPLSLRKAMEEAARRPAPEPEDAGQPAAGTPEDDLVTRLCRGEHPVEVSLRPEKTVAVLKECLAREFVHVKFTGTRGGTELGFRVDPTRSQIDSADVEAGRGRIRLVGELTLDYVKVRCSADVDLETLCGTGQLERLEAL